MILTRRNLFGLIAAPAVIRVAQLMPISVPFVPRFGTSVFEREEYIAAQCTLNFITREMLRYARPVLFLDKLGEHQSAIGESLKRDTIKFLRPEVVG
jgi:hypothetical protein